MRLQHYFFYFPKAISKPICNKIIKRCKSKEFSKGTVVEMSFSKSDLAKNYIVYISINCTLIEIYISY